MQQKTMLIDKMIKHQSPQKYNSTVNQIGADRDPFFTVCPAFSRHDTACSLCHFHLIFITVIRIMHLDIV